MIGWLIHDSWTLRDHERKLSYQTKTILHEISVQKEVEPSPYLKAGQFRSQLRQFVFAFLHGIFQTFHPSLNEIDGSRYTEN